MKTRGLDMTLAKADPIDTDRLDRLDLEALEAELLADLDDERPAPPSPWPASRPNSARGAARSPSAR